MRKFFAPILIFLILSLLLTGCRSGSFGPSKSDRPARPAETAAPTEAPATEAPTQAPATQPPATEPPVTEAPRDLPYQQEVARYDQSVYDGPGYDYVFVGAIPEPGIYTIVEEFRDADGNLWGKLKSGMGWVDLTEIQSPDYESAPISANYADDGLLRHGNHHFFSTGNEYTVPVAFHAYGRLRDVELFVFEFGADGLIPGAVLFILPELTDAKPLVAELDFPGDMTTYGIRFTDESGTAHVCSIYISGRNGALVLGVE